MDFVILRRLQILNLLLQGDYHVFLRPIVIKKESDAEALALGDCEPVYEGRITSSNTNRLVAVLEFARAVKTENIPEDDQSKHAFDEEDEEIADSYCALGEVVLHYIDLYFRIERQKKLNAFLLHHMR